MIHHAKNFRKFRKVIVFGDSGVGKSTFIKALDAQVRRKYIPRGEEFYTSFIESKILGKDKPLDLIISECNIRNEKNQLFLKENQNLLFKDCLLVIFIYDCTNRDSFHALIELYVLFLPFLNNPTQVLLISSKNDKKKRRKFNTMQIQSFKTFHINLTNKADILNVADVMYQILYPINNKIPIYNLVEITSFRRTDKTLITRITLLGDSQVGKTCLTKSFIDQSFLFPFASSIVEISRDSKGILYNNKEYEVILWDTAGQERYKSIPKTWCVNANAILVLYDVSNSKSLIGASDWITSIEQQFGICYESGSSNEESSSDSERGDVKKPYVALIGNKIDLYRNVERRDAMDFAKKHKIGYYEISCKYHLNVYEMFGEIILKLIHEKKYREKGQSLSSRNSHIKKCCES
jgi:GTPase SAR1 family protein